MAKLNDAAKDVLAGWGQEPISEREWARYWGHGTDWGGDECGCPDDRCIGHHHLRDEPCFCLRTLVREYPNRPK